MGKFWGPCEATLAPSLGGGRRAHGVGMGCQWGGEGGAGGVEVLGLGSGGDEREEEVTATPLGWQEGAGEPCRCSAGRYTCCPLSICLSTLCLNRGAGGCSRASPPAHPPAAFSSVLRDVGRLRRKRELGKARLAPALVLLTAPPPPQHPPGSSGVRGTPVPAVPAAPAPLATNMVLPKHEHPHQPNPAAPSAPENQTPGAVRPPQPRFGSFSSPHHTPPPPKCHAPLSNNFTRRKELETSRASSTTSFPPSWGTAAALAPRAPSPGAGDSPSRS